MSGENLHLKAVIILSLKYNKKVYRFCLKFSSVLNTSVLQVRRWQNSPFPNQCPLILLSPDFQPSGQDQQNGKQTYCQLLL